MILFENRAFAVFDLERLHYISMASRAQPPLLFELLHYPDFSSCRYLS